MHIDLFELKLAKTEDNFWFEKAVRFWPSLIFLGRVCALKTFQRSARFLFLPSRACLQA